MVMKGADRVSSTVDVLVLLRSCIQSCQSFSGEIHEVIVQQLRF